jgi:hypothetical protein
MRTPRRAHNVVLCLLPAALCVGATLAMPGCGGPPPTSATTSTPGAGLWVPFEGEFRAVSGGSDTRGRVFRRRDGSFRKETLDLVGVPAFITIENRARRRFYSFSAGGWTAQPWTRTPPPPPGRERYPNAAAQADRVAGLRVVRWDTGIGVMTLRAPELDYFALVEEHPYPPLRIRFVSVTRADQPDALFEPPAGSRIDEVPWEYEGAFER